LEQSNPAISYQLTTGWNMVGYTGTAENSGIVNQINTALSNDATVENTFQVIKNVSGQFWSSTFAQISNFTQGEGYMMYVITETAPELSFLNTINLPVVLGCLDCSSEFYNPWATQSDGSCGFSNQGCTDENYIEYNDQVSVEDGSCLTLVSYGCTYPLALNYDAAANTDDGSCIYFESEVSQDVYWPTDVSEINTGSNSTYLIQSANLDGSSVIYGYLLGAFFVNDEGNLQCGGFTNCGSNSVQLAVMGDDTTTEEKDGFYDGEEITWLAYGTFAEQTYSATVLFSQTAPFGSDTYSTSGLNIITEFNIIASTPITLACPYDAYLEYSSTATDYNVSECLTLVVEGCTSDLYFEYNPEANREDGSCLTLVVEGCTDSTYAEYNTEANTDDGSCNTLIVLGCNNPLADNYNAQANTNDGTCIIYGCMDMLADNYNAEANIDDDCIYYGCINTTADNYNENANTDDGTCIIYGCTLAAFPNYNAVATADDFSCDMNSTDVFGCIDLSYLEYDPSVNQDNGTCSVLVVYGCTVPNDCNYNPEANTDDGSCIYLQEGYDCEGNFIAQIGDVMEGGYLFYIDETGEHGLVAAMEDLGSYEWGCNGTSISGADGQSIGTGLQNTLDIVSGCSETPIAASEALAHESEGYSDWYLPSKDALQEMYNTIGNGGSQGNIGGFSNSYYWSSSEFSSNFAWNVNFDDGDTTNYFYKSNTYRVRVVRAF
jgi:hypothetical protein